MDTDKRFSRTEMLIGQDAMDWLSRMTVAIFGLGGVGSYAAESLARCGVGRFVLVDGDCICETNINRQIHALSSTVGMAKTDAMKLRIMDINPKAEVLCMKLFYLPGVEGLSWEYDYVLDAVDTITAKLAIAMEAKKRGIPVISAMAAGNKLDPGAFKVADIYETSVCPIAKVMRQELRKRNVEELKVVYSQEKPLCTQELPGSAADAGRKRTLGSISFVPPVVGMMMAAEVVKDLISG